MRVHCLLVLLVAGLGPVLAEEKVPPKVTYDDHVKPILQQKCFSCHNPDKKSADLDLTTYTNLMQGGASGTVIEVGDSAASYLFQLVTHESEPVMPPESPKIADEMIETLRKWIDDGVLENSGSTAKASQKKKFDLGLAAPSTERPAVAPMPARMSLQPILSPPTRTATDALATSPWAPLAAVSSQHQVLLYRTDTLELVGVLPFPEGTPRVLKFSRNGSLLLAGGGVGGASGRVVVWDIRSGDRIIEVGEELDEVLAADISSDQTLIALAGPQRVIRIYSTDSGRLMHEIRKHTDWVTSLEFSPDSVLLATGDRNGGLYVWEAWTGREYLTLNGHTASITAVSWRSDSNILASSSEDTTIKLWEMDNGSQVKNWGAHGGGASCVEFTRDGRLFSSGRDLIAKLWDQNGAQQVAYEAFGDLALRATFCDETGRAISGDWNGEIRVWNATDGVRVGELVMNPPTLVTRLMSAQQRLDSASAALTPVAETHKQAMSALEQMRVTVAAAQQAAADAKAKAEVSANALAVAQQAATAAAEERNAMQQRVDGLTVAVPILREAADKAAAASASLPSDENLVAASRTIASTADAKTLELESSRQSLAQKTQAAEQAAMEIGALEKAVQETTTLLATAQKSEQDLLAQLPGIEAAATAAQQAFDQATGELNAAQQAVTRWTDEIAFNQQLETLLAQRSQSAGSVAEQEAKLAELQAVADAAAAELRKTQESITSGQASLAAAETEYPMMLAAIETAKQAQQAALIAKDQAAASVDRLQQVLTSVGEATQKMEQARALQQEDPALDAAIASLKNLAAEKTALLEATKADLMVKVTAVQDAETLVQTMQNNAASSLASQESIKAQIPQWMAALPMLEQTSNETKAAVDAFAPEVAKVREQLAAVQSSIAALRGLTATP
jgi:hypothetical protein